MNRMAWVLVGCLLGGGVVLGLQGLLAPVAEQGENAQQVVQQRSRSGAVGYLELAERSVGAPRPQEPAVPLQAPDELPLITEALRDHARAGLRRGWSTVRDDSMPAEEVAAGLEEYEARVLSMAEGLGRWRAEDRDAVDALTDWSDVEALLTVLDDVGGPLLELVEDPQAFEELFRPQAVGPGRSGPHVGETVPSDLPPGITLTYPAGVFRVDMRSLQHKGFPEDLTLQGAGLGATLLVVGGISSGREPMRRFSIRDCTVFTDDDPLLDQRSSPATLVFERVRFLGFDRGAGSSAWIDADLSALLVRDCVIEGGYGDSPNGAGLLDIRTDGLLARFERCTIRRVEFPRFRSGATVVFEGCQLDDLFSSVGDPREHAPSGVRFPGTSVTVAPYWPPQNPGDVPQYDLESLFPGWREQLGRR